MRNNVDTTSRIGRSKSFHNSFSVLLAPVGYLGPTAKVSHCVAPALAPVSKCVCWLHELTRIGSTCCSTLCSVQRHAQSSQIFLSACAVLTWGILCQSFNKPTSFTPFWSSFSIAAESPTRYSSLSSSAWQLGCSSTIPGGCRWENLAVSPFVHSSDGVLSKG